MQTFVRFLYKGKIIYLSQNAHQRARDPDSKLPGSLFMGFYEILHHKLIKLFVSIPTRKLPHDIHHSDPS